MSVRVAGVCPAMDGCDKMWQIKLLCHHIQWPQVRNVTSQVDQTNEKLPLCVRSSVSYLLMRTVNQRLSDVGTVWVLGPAGPPRTRPHRLPGARTRTHAHTRRESGEFIRRAVLSCSSGSEIGS